ncbi:MAG: hypothetical protein RLZZ299_3091 [Pseudomonadota bacterium]|jgi:hypothetical protein
MVALALLLACGPDIRALHAQARTDALASASDDLRPDWRPDVRVDIAPPALRDATRTSVEVALQALPTTTVALPLGLGVTLAPELTLESLALTADPACPSCVDAALDLGGSVRWSVGGRSGSLRVRGGAEAVLAFDVEERTRVLARLRDVRRVRLQLGAIPALDVDATEVVRATVRESLARRVPPTLLTDVSGSTLPLRTLRVRARGAGAVIDMLSDAPAGTPVAEGEPLADGVRVRMSTATLTTLLRREAFRTGAVGLDTWVDPHDVRFGDGTFSLRLRLWRLAGRGWWRDYAVSGSARVRQGALELAAVRAEEQGRSRGAALSDPLAVLAEGLVLRGLSRALTTSLPGETAVDAGGVALSTRLVDVRGSIDGGWVEVLGNLAVRRGGAAP